MVCKASCSRRVASIDAELKSRQRPRRNSQRSEVRRGLDKVEVEVIVLRGSIAKRQRCDETPFWFVNDDGLRCAEHVGLLPEVSLEKHRIGHRIEHKCGDPG